MSKDSIYIHGTSTEEQVRLSKLNQILNQSCLNALNIRKGECILDVGSGLGQFSRLMGAFAERQVLGIERDDAQRTSAINMAAQDEETEMATFRAGDAMALPLAPDERGQFDLVHCRFVLEHLRHPLQAVKEMVSAVKTGGRVVICDDDHANFRPTPLPFGFSALWKAYVRSFDRLGNDPFIGRRLVELMHTAGLKELQNKLIFFGGCAGNDQFELIADNLIGILNGAREQMLAEQLISERAFEQGIAGLEFWRKQPDAALWYAICWVEGKKI